MYTIVLLTEHALTSHDVDRLASLHEPEPVSIEVVARAEAQQAVADSVEALRAAGLQAEARSAGHDVVEAVRALAEEVGADEVVVITEPHLINDALHRDWASRIRGEVALPVLHFLAGTDQVVS